MQNIFVECALPHETKGPIRLDFLPLMAMCGSAHRKSGLIGFLLSKLVRTPRDSSGPAWAARNESPDADGCNKATTEKANPL